MSPSLHEELGAVCHREAVLHVYDEQPGCGLLHSLKGRCSSCGRSQVCSPWVEPAHREPVNQLQSGADRRSKFFDGSYSLMNAALKVTLQPATLK